MLLTVTRVKALAAATVFAVAVGMPAIANAQTGVATASGPATTQPPEVLGEVVERPQAPVTTAGPEVLDTNVSAGLAVTGSDITGLSLLGLGGIVAGSALLASRRRRTS